MALLQNNAEGGTDTVVATAGNTGGASGDALNNFAGSPIFSATSPIKGSLSYSFPSASNAQLIGYDDASPSASFSFRFYFTIAATPSGTHQLVSVRTTAATLATDVSINTSRQVQTTVGSTAAGFSGSALTAGTIYRCEGQATGFGTASSAMNVQIYVGDNTGTPFISSNVSGATTSAQCQRIRYGKNSAGTLSGMQIDALAQNIGSSSVIGPSATNFTATVDDVMGLDDSSGNQSIAYGDVYLDPEGLTDTMTVSVGRNITVTDNLGLTDTQTILKTLTVSQTDNLGLTDTVVVDQFEGLAVDAMGLTDTTLVSKGFSQTPTDDTGLTDNIAVTQSDSFTDNLGLTDTTGPVFTKPFSDNLGLTDTIAVTETNGYTDAMGLTDVLSVTDRMLVMSDNMGLSDNVGVAATGNVNASINDMENLTDTAVTTTTSIRSQSDDAGLTDSVSVGYQPPMSDPIGMTDSMSVQPNVGVNDSEGLTDTVTATAGVIKIFAESLGITDTVIANNNVVVGTDDSLGLTDSVSPVLTYSVLEALGLSDTVAYILNSSRPVTDDAGLTDSIQVLTISPFNFVVTHSDLVHITDEAIVYHLKMSFLPPYFTSGNRRTYVTDGTDPGTPTNH